MGPIGEDTFVLFIFLRDNLFTCLGVSDSVNISSSGRFSQPHLIQVVRIIPLQFSSVGRNEWKKWFLYGQSQRSQFSVFFFFFCFVFTTWYVAFFFIVRGSQAAYCSKLARDKRQRPSTFTLFNCLLITFIFIFSFLHHDSFLFTFFFFFF